MTPDKFISIKINSQPLISTPDELTEYIQSSNEGRALSGACRFDSFRGDISPENWETILGPDVNNLRHMTFTADIAKQLVDDENTHPKGRKSTPSEVLTLLITARTHDLAEAEVGDTSAGLKTPLNEHREKQILRNQLLIIDQFCDPTIKNCLKEVPDIAFPDEIGGNNLATFFNAIECVGYLTTALRARRIYKLLELGLSRILPHDMEETTAIFNRSSLSENLRRLSTEVVGGPYFTRLVRHSDALPSISDLLIKNSETIREIFHSDPSFEWYENDDRLTKHPHRTPTEEPNFRERQFIDSHLAWRSFVASRLS